MGSTYATSHDIAATWRPLDDAETAVANRLCIDASFKLRQAFPDLDERIAAGELDPEAARIAVQQMVLRFMRNPDAYNQEGIVNWSASHGQFSTGWVKVTDEERELVRPAPTQRIKPAGTLRVRSWTAP